MNILIPVAVSPQRQRLIDEMEMRRPHRLLALYDAGRLAFSAACRTLLGRPHGRHRDLRASAPAPRTAVTAAAIRDHDAVTRQGPQASRPVPPVVRAPIPLGLKAGTGSRPTDSPPVRTLRASKDGVEAPRFASTSTHTRPGRPRRSLNQTPKTHSAVHVSRGFGHPGLSYASRRSKLFRNRPVCLRSFRAHKRSLSKPFRPAAECHYRRHSLRQSRYAIREGRTAPTSGHRTAPSTLPAAVEQLDNAGKVVCPAAQPGKHLVQRLRLRAYTERPISEGLRKP